MKMPCCRALCVGEVSAWGRQFLNDLQQRNLIDLKHETVDQFCQALTVPPDPIAVFVENSPESRQSILRMRKSEQTFLWIWFGRSFSKEDFAFAMEMRAFAAFENPKSEDRKVHERVGRMASQLESLDEHRQVLCALKTLLLQAESERGQNGPDPFLHETKVALGKMERIRIAEEFLGGSTDGTGENESKAPFYSTRDFSDALTTVQNLERTGTLWVRGNLPNQEGSVDFLQGKIVSSVSGSVRGLKAIYRMFLWDEPKFQFTRRNPQDFVVEDNVNVGMKFVCVEGQDLKRRFEQIRREIPPHHVRLSLEPSAVHEGTRLSREDFATLAGVVEHGDVGELVDYSPLNDVILYESLIRLRKTNLVRVVPKPV